MASIQGIQFEEFQRQLKTTLCLVPDFVPIPSLTPSSKRRDDRITGQDEPPQPSIEDITAGTPTVAQAPSEAPSCHVVQGCSMAGEGVALALTDGRLCHAIVSQASEVVLKNETEKAWPEWSTWKSRHGRVLQLAYSPAHDALMTLEHASTAAGDQVFLTRYHREAVTRGRSTAAGAAGGATASDKWESCSIPLATSSACMAVCSSRGWAAVCSGSMVNLWAVPRPRAESANSRASGPRQASGGFEHALDVDLMELVGTGDDGVPRHLALLGNLLAVGTDHAVFILRLSFELKGESAGCGRSPACGENPPSVAQSALGEDDEQPSGFLSRKSKAGGAATSSRSNLTSSLGEPSQRLGGRSGSFKGSTGGSRTDEPPGVRGDAQASSTRDTRKGGGKEPKSDGRGSPPRGDGGRSKEVVVERAVMEAEKMLVCVMQEGSETADGMANDGPAPPPPLLRSFDDDWKACASREEPCADESWWELETMPITTDSSRLSLPTSGNPAVLDRVNVCEVILARRAAPGETIKELHLLPVFCGDSDRNPRAWPGCRSPSPSSSPPLPTACRFMMLTSKGATACGLLAEKPPRAASPTPSSSSPDSSLLPWPASLWSSPMSVSPPRSISVPREVDVGTSAHLQGGGVGNRGYVDVRCEGASADSGLEGESIGRGGGVGSNPSDWPVRIFLRFSCRFNHDLIRATISRSFLIALTVEGLEVWTLPSESLAASGSGGWEGDLLERACVGSERAAPSLSPPPRPCLLHLQKLGVDGAVPRSLTTGLLAVGEERPGVLLFPSVPCRVAPSSGSSIPFLNWQSQRLLRSSDAGDEVLAPEADHDTPGLGSSALRSPATSLSVARRDDAADRRGAAETWRRKYIAWREGFCRQTRAGDWGSGVVDGADDGSPLMAVLLRLRNATGAFQNLAAGVERVPRPLSATIAAAFLAAAEGLHEALTVESFISWRVAVNGPDLDSYRNRGLGMAGGKIYSPAVENGSGVAPARATIESILPELIRCWKLQGVAARCASTISRLCLDEAERIASESTADDEVGYLGAASILQAFSLGCRWLLVSGETVAESCVRLREYIARIVDAANAAQVMEDPSEEASEGTSSVSGGEQGVPSEAASRAGTVDLSEALSGIMYDTYLLPALGLGGRTGRDRITVAPRLASNSPEGNLGPLDAVLSGLVGFLRGRDKVHGSPGSDARSANAEGNRFVSLAMAVVCAGRAPWIACPGALSHALHALDDEQASWCGEGSPVVGAGGSSSGSNGSSSSVRLGTKTRKESSATPSSRASSAAQSRRASASIRRTRSDNRRERGNNGLAEVVPIDGGMEARADSRTFTTPAWIAVARSVLEGYSQTAAGTAAQGNDPPRHSGSCGPSAVDFAPTSANDAMLQLACEKHRALVVAPDGGPGPLAGTLLAAGRLRPLVLALVRLTSGTDCGSEGGGARLGPQRAKDLLDLASDCFSARLDPLQALCVLGNPGRQIAGRLDSLMQTSLEAAGAQGASRAERPPPVMFQQLSEDPENGASAPTTTAGIDNSVKIAPEILEAAARDFLTLRCSVSVAQASHAVSVERRLSEAEGAPLAWQTSLARKRVVHRAILRFLIGAHLDDLRALEAPATVRSSASRSPAGAAELKHGAVRVQGCGPVSRGFQMEKSCWTDAVVGLLAGRASGGAEGVAEVHLGAIVALLRDISCPSGARSVWGSSLPGGFDMTAEEASEVATEAKRRLPAPTPASVADFHALGQQRNADHTVAWGSGGIGMGMRRSPWPWPPRGVPASAVGALVALAAALPLAGNLIGGVDVMLQVAAEAVAAAKAEAAVAAGVAAAAAASSVRGVSKRTPAFSAAPGAKAHAAPSYSAPLVEEVEQAAEKTLLLYVTEYCGTDPTLWETVTCHVRSVLPLGERGAVDAVGVGDGDERLWPLRLLSGLLRSCGKELGGADLVRAIPEELTLIECLDEVERVLVPED